MSGQSQWLYLFHAALRIRQYTQFTNFPRDGRVLEFSPRECELENDSYQAEAQHFFNAT